MNAKSFWKHSVLWLENNSPEGLSRDDLHRYFDHEGGPDRPNSIEGLFRLFLKSLTQAGMMEGVIVAAMPEGIQSLEKVTFKFSLGRTHKHYAGNHLSLFEDVQTKIKPTGKLREEGLWPRYCKTILSAAKFLQQFESADDFYVWVDRLKSDQRIRVGLPLMLSEELFGAGFALACNILIDLGYAEFAKPDRHVKRILQGAGLLDSHASDYQALRTVLDTSDAVGITPYALDKALFLIGSGRYFRHSELAVGNKRERTEKFLAYLSAA